LRYRLGGILTLKRQRKNGRAVTAGDGEHITMNRRQENPLNVFARVSIIGGCGVARGFLAGGARAAHRSYPQTLGRAHLPLGGGRKTEPSLKHSETNARFPGEGDYPQALPGLHPRATFRRPPHHL
jgi:hypothetical protein